MEFRCRVATPAGEVRDEVHVAETEVRLRRELEDRGLVLLAARPAGSVSIPGLGLPAFRMPTRKRLPQRDFLVFNQELATLLKAGMPLVQSLDILRQRVLQPTFKQILDDVYEQVRGGTSLSDAFASHRDLVPGIYTASLLAGEKSGGLEQVLRRYVSYVKMISGIRRKTISAMVYPAILIALSISVVILIVVKVVPAFADFYANFGRELPWLTRVIIGLSTFLITWWPAVLLGLVGGGMVVWGWTRQPGQKVRIHRWALRVPVLGPTAQKFATSQVARTVATLLTGGIPLVNALSVASDAVGNRYVASELLIVGQRVREGEGLATSMRARGVFSDVTTKMVEVGESTGALQDMLNSLADFYDEEIDTTLTRFVTMIEPLLLVVMGFVIATLLLALYLPVFELSSVVSR